MKGITQTVLFCAFSSEVAGRSALKTTSYYIPSTSQSTEKTSTGFILPEDISHIPILRTKGQAEASQEVQLKC